MQVLSAVASTGSKMTIGDAAVTAILGYAVVFFGLVLLMFVIILFGKVMVASARKKAAAKAAPAPTPAPEPAMPAPGGVRVTLDDITPPGAIYSGKVSFPGQCRRHL